MIGVESHTDIHVVRFGWILQPLKWELNYELSEDWEIVEPNCNLRVNHPTTLLSMQASACVICARKVVGKLQERSATCSVLLDRLPKNPDVVGRMFTPQTANSGSIQWGRSVILLS